MSQVDSSANVWSEKARKAIKEHDKSCLGKGRAKEPKKTKKKNKKPRQYREKMI